MRLHFSSVLALVLASCASTPERVPDVRGEEVRYEARGEEMRGYVAYDANRQGRRPGVLVVHEWWGHNDYARRRADQLAAMGYTAFALDMYGGGKQAGHPKDAAAFMNVLLADMDLAEARFAAAQAQLAAHPTSDPQRVAAVGYCFGGGIVLHMARIGADLDAVASFHGALAPAAPERGTAAGTRVLVLHGAADPFVKPEQIEAFHEEMQKAGVDYRFVAYPGVQHSFTNPGATAVGLEFELPLAYNAAADRKSWNELEQFLSETFSE